MEQMYTIVGTCKLSKKLEVLVVPNVHSKNEGDFIPFIFSEKSELDEVMRDLLRDDLKKIFQDQYDDIKVLTYELKTNEALYQEGNSEAKNE